MQRRKFLSTAGATLAAGAAAIPALSPAQTAALPTIKWRLTSSFPKSLDTIFGAAEVISKRVAAATGGSSKFKYLQRQKSSLHSRQWMQLKMALLNVVTQHLIIFSVKTRRSRLHALCHSA